MKNGQVGNKPLFISSQSLIYDDLGFILIIIWENRVVVITPLFFFDPSNSYI